MSSLRKSGKQRSDVLNLLARMPLAAARQLGVETSATEAGYLDGVTAGTTIASKAVVVDSSKNNTGINNLSITGDMVIDGAASTGAGCAGVLTLTTPELTVVAADQLGRIDFQAPLESSGTDAILVGASIVAVASATFDTTHNSTDIVLMTGDSEAPLERTRVSSVGLMTHAFSAAFGNNATDRVTFKGIYMNPAVIAVAVPTIANDAAENGDSVAVDVSAAFSIQPAVGDAVIPIPMAALPTDCLLCGAYVTATDTITVTFMSKEGGGGVTGANVNFNFLVIDVT